MNELAAELGRLLRERHMTIATAESCTAGGIGAAIASVDGASEYFLGGVIAYSVGVKNRVLGVDDDLIGRYGVVSREVAEAMNDGVRRLSHADVAISITGYAGQNGGDRFAENGTVWICIGSDGTTPLVKCLHVSSDRTANLRRAVDEALSCAVRFMA